MIKSDSNLKNCGYITPAVLTVKLESCQICQASNPIDDLFGETDLFPWEIL